MLAVTVPGDPGGTLIFTRMVSQGNSCEFGHYDHAHSFVRSLEIYFRAVHEKHPGLAIVLGLFVLFGVVVVGLHVFAILASIVITVLVVLAVFMFLAGMISFKK